MADLAGAILEFATLLRTDYEIDAGHAQAHDALKALEIAGLQDSRRVRYAMRSVFCSKAEEIPRFDKAFDSFFFEHLRRRRHVATPAPKESAQSFTASRREAQSGSSSPDARGVLHARYSASASQTHASPAVPTAGLARTIADAARLLAALRLGRSRRWKPHPRGRRFDLRRTLRASLQTCGDPVHVRALGHPLRNPRIVVLLDASRSMSGHVEPMLQFAYALCKRSRRTRAFVFSTSLREITRDLRGGEPRLRPLGEAWGGGTRIGACLLEFLRKHGGNVDADTLTIVVSDGLDVGEIAYVQSAMRQLYRRSAGVVWLNPHASARGFEPSAAGMKAALPYVSALLDAGDLSSIGAVARHLRR